MNRPAVLPLHSVSSIGFKGRSTIGHGAVSTPRESDTTPRPRTMPNIIGFDGLGIKPTMHSRNSGYFPPRKLKSSQDIPQPRHSRKHTKNESDRILILESNSGLTSPRPFTGLSTNTSLSSRTRDGFRPRRPIETPRTAGSVKTRNTQDLFSRTPTNNTFQTNDSNVTGDLSYLAKPKHIELSTHSPWVYRYKVKRSMNTLAKIMSSPNNNTTPSLAVNLHR